MKNRKAMRAIKIAPNLSFSQLYRIELTELFSGLGNVVNDCFDFSTVPRFQAVPPPNWPCLIGGECWNVIRNFNKNYEENRSDWVKDYLMLYIQQCKRKLCSAKKLAVLCHIGWRAINSRIGMILWLQKYSGKFQVPSESKTNERCINGYWFPICRTTAQRSNNIQSFLFCRFTRFTL